MIATLPENIRSRIATVLPEVRALRHALHRIPELAGEEHETAALLRERLAPLPVTVLPPFLGTDVVGFVGDVACGERGRPPSSPNVTLRADIDALPMAEASGKEYASVHPGRMHACGHDGHAAMLWGAVRVLSEFRECLRGSVRFIFQPGEELRAMARPLLEAGAMDSPTADWVFGLHGWPGLAQNAVASRVGTILASAGTFRIRVIGKGGHGAKPELACNPHAALPVLIPALHAIPQRTPFRERTVVTVCHVEGGSNANIIPGEILVEGTTRTLDDEDTRAMATAVRKAMDEAAVPGLRYVLDDEVNYPATRCDAEAVALLKECAGAAYVGDTAPAMGAEDFSYYTQRARGAYAFIGHGTAWQPLHTPDFDFNDAILETGVSLLVSLALHAP